MNEKKIFAGLVTNDFVFRGVDEQGGATFEHAPCGWFTRYGPGAEMDLLFEDVKTHECENREKDEHRAITEIRDR